MTFFNFSHKFLASSLVLENMIEKNIMRPSCEPNFLFVSQCMIYVTATLCITDESRIKEKNLEYSFQFIVTSTFEMYYLIDLYNKKI